MRIFAASLILLMFAGFVLADLPTSQPVAAYSYNCQIKSIGKDTLEVHTLRGHSGIIHPVNVDEKTEIVLLNGQPGKLSDLRVGQWVKLYTDDVARIQRALRIEPGMPSWAAQRLADLEMNAASLDVAVHVSINGKGDEEELHLLGPETKGGYKEPFFASLTNDEMLKLLRYLSVEGFLADAFNDMANTPPQAPLAPPYVTISVGHYSQSWPLNSETLKRLEGIKSVLPEKAAVKMEGLLLPRVRKVLSAAASQPAANVGHVIQVGDSAATQPLGTITTGMPLQRAIDALKAAGGRETEMDMAPPESNRGGIMKLKCFELADGRAVCVVADRLEKSKIFTLVEITVCDEPNRPKAERTWRKVDSLDVVKPATSQPAAADK